MKRVYYDQFPEGVAFRFLNRPPSTTKFPPRKLGRKIEHSHVGRFFRGRATSGVTRFLLLLRRIHSRYLPFPTSLTFAAQSSPIRNNFPPSGQSCNLLWYLQPSLLSFVSSFTRRRKNEMLFSREKETRMPLYGEIFESTLFLKICLKKKIRFIYSFLFSYYKRNGRNFLIRRNKYIYREY